MENSSEKEEPLIMDRIPFGKEPEAITPFTLTKVVTRNFIMDFVANLQNMFGLNLTSYERMVDKGMQQIKEQLQIKQVSLKWFRYEITQLTNGAVSITLYGETR